MQGVWSYQHVTGNHSCRVTLEPKRRACTGEFIEWGSNQQTQVVLVVARRHLLGWFIAGFCSVYLFLMPTAAPSTPTPLITDVAASTCNYASRGWPQEDTWAVFPQLCVVSMCVYGCVCVFVGGWSRVWLGVSMLFACFVDVPRRARVCVYPLVFCVMYVC